MKNKEPAPAGAEKTTAKGHDATVINKLCGSPIVYRRRTIGWFKRNEERFKRLLKKSEDFYALSDPSLWRLDSTKRKPFERPQKNDLAEVTDDKTILRHYTFYNRLKGTIHHPMIVGLDRFEIITLGGQKDCEGKDCKFCWAAAKRLNWILQTTKTFAPWTKWKDQGRFRWRIVEHKGTSQLYITMYDGDKNRMLYFVAEEALGLLSRDIGGALRFVAKLQNRRPDVMRHMLKKSRSPHVRLIKIYRDAQMLDSSEAEGDADLEDDV